MAGDYQSYMSSLMRDLERRLLDEHQRILACHGSNVQAVIADLQQKQRTLRKQLYYRGSVTENADNESRWFSNTESGQLIEFPEELLPEFPEEQAFRHSPGNARVMNGLLSTPAGTPRTGSFVGTSVCTPISLWPLSPREPDVALMSNQPLTPREQNQVEDVSSSAQVVKPVEKQVLPQKCAEYAESSVTILKPNGMCAGPLVLWPEWELNDEDMTGLDSYLQYAPSQTFNLAKLKESSEDIDDEEDADAGDLGLEQEEDDHDSRALNWYSRDEERDRLSFMVMAPDNKFALVWEYLGLPLLLYDVLTIPMQVFDLPKNAMFLEVMTPIILAYWSLDIFRRMFQGYNKKDGTKVLRLRKIARKYVCSSAFAFDMVLVIADAFFIFIEDSNILASLGLGRLSKLLKVWHMFSLLRLMRLKKVRSTMDLLQEKIDSALMSALIDIMAKLGVILTINHFIACFWYFVGTQTFPGGTTEGYRNWTSVYFKSMDRAESWQFMFLTSLHWSVCQFTPGGSPVQPQNAVELAIAIGILMFAMLVFSSFVSSVTNAMQTAQGFSARHRQEILMFRRYCRQHKVSEDLALRADRYISYLPKSNLGGVQFKDVKLFNLLTAPLRNELLTELHMPHLTVHPFFEKLSKRCNAMVRKLCCSAVKQENLSMQDVLFSTGQMSNDMYFVTKGSLNYMMKDPNGSSAYINEHIPETQWCCELTLWTRWLHTGSMYVAAECTVLSLNAQHFRDAVLEYHLDMRLVKVYASLFISYVNEIHDKGEHVIDIVSLDVLQSPAMLRFLSTKRTKGNSSQFLYSNNTDITVTIAPGT